MWLLAIAIALAIGFAIRYGHGETPDEWLELVVKIQRTPCAYKDNYFDELFIAKMINLLTLDNPPEPTRAEQKWIRTLKKECKL